MRDKFNNYWATVSGIPKKFLTFADAICYLEKSTGVNYPF
jgi:hypothetical protein